MKKKMLRKRIFPNDYRRVFSTNRLPHRTGSDRRNAWRRPPEQGPFPAGNPHSRADHIPASQRSLFVRDLELRLVVIKKNFLFYSCAGVIQLLDGASAPPAPSAEEVAAEKQRVQEEKAQQERYDAELKA